MQLKARNVNVTVASGSSSFLDGTISVPLTPNAHLKGIAIVAININALPLRASINVLPMGTAGIPVAAGWVRGGPTTPIEDGSISWTGDMPLGITPSANIGLRNDTGAAGIVTVAIVEEV